MLSFSGQDSEFDSLFLDSPPNAKQPLETGVDSQLENKKMNNDPLMSVTRMDSQDFEDCLEGFGDLSSQNGSLNDFFLSEISDEIDNLPSQEPPAARSSQPAQTPTLPQTGRRPQRITSIRINADEATDLYESLNLRQEVSGPRIETFDKSLVTAKRPQIRLIRTGPVGSTGNLKPAMMPTKTTVAPPQKKTVAASKISRAREERDSLSPSPSEVSSTSSRVRSQSRSSNWGGCQSKQAQYAREYRMKNKLLVEELSGKIEELEACNTGLKTQLGDSKSTIEDLSAEVMYLRGVLANESSLSALLAGVQNTPGVKFRFPISQPDSISSTVTSTGPSTRGKRKADNPQRSTNAKVLKNSQPMDASEAPGVCLHMKNGEVSVEFCGRCNVQSRCVPHIQ